MAELADPPLGSRIAYGRVVDLERVDAGRYDGICHAGGGPDRAYGGAVLAQGLAAAADMVAADAPGRGFDSLHAYFVAAVSALEPVRFEATILRAGRRYAVCRVDGHQRGRLVVTLTASFKTPEPHTHVRHAAMPVGIAGPEDLSDKPGAGVRRFPRAEVMDYREAGWLRSAAPGEYARASWFRIKHPVGDQPIGSACALVYLTDRTLAPTAFGAVDPQAPRSGLVLASLDHAVWLHQEPGRVDTRAWLLFVQRSRIESDGRTFARGEIWTRDGELVASVAQEALIRIPDAARRSH